MSGSYEPEENAKDKCGSEDSELRFFVTLTSGIRLDSKHSRAIGFLEQKGHEDGYCYIKEKVASFLKEIEGYSIKSLREISEYVLGGPSQQKSINKPKHLSYQEDRIMGSSYYKVKYQFLDIDEFKLVNNVDYNVLVPVQATEVPACGKGKEKNENALEHRENVLFIVPNQSNSYYLKLVYDLALILLYNAGPTPKVWGFFSMDFSSRLIFLILPVAKLDIELEFRDEENLKNKNKMKMYYYLIPIVKFVMNERKQIRKTFSLSLMFVPRVKDNENEKIEKNEIKISDIERMDRLDLPDFETEAQISGDLVDFLVKFINYIKINKNKNFIDNIIKNFDNYIKPDHKIEIRNIYALILLALIFIFSNRKNAERGIANKIGNPKEMWDTLADLIESSYLRHVHINENPKPGCKPILADDETINRLAYGEKPDKNWIKRLHTLLSEKTETYSNFDFKNYFLDYFYYGELYFVSEYTIYSVKNVRDYERGILIDSGLNTWVTFYFISSFISMLQATLYSAYNEVSQGNGEDVIYIEEDMIDDLYELYDLDFAPYFKQIFRKVRNIFGADSSYQALKDMLELTKDNDTRKWERRLQNAFLALTAVEVVGLPLLVYFEKKDVEDTILYLAVLIFISLLFYMLLNKIEIIKKLFKS